MNSFLNITKSLSPSGLHKTPPRIQEVDNEDNEDNGKNIADQSASDSDSESNSDNKIDKSGNNTDNEDDNEVADEIPQKESVLSPAETTSVPLPAFRRHQVLNIVDSAVLKKELKTMGSINTGDGANVKIVIEKKKLSNDMNKLDFDNYGVNIKLLKKLFVIIKKYCRQKSLDPYKFTIDQVINNIISPWTQRHSSSLCNILLNADGINKDDLYISTLKKMKNLSNCIISNQANVYVIYARSYYYYNFMESLEVLACNRINCYFWLDFLCMKQINNTFKHSDEDNADTKKESRPIKWFQNNMVDLMKNIGHTVLVLLKWTTPLIFSRSWCLFELYAAHLANCNFSIQLSRKRHNEFYRIVVDDYDRAAQLCHVDINIEQSTSRDGSDRDELLNAIYSISDCSFLNANGAIYNLLKNWLLKFAIAEVTHELDITSRNINSIANANCLLKSIKSIICMRDSTSKLQSLHQNKYNLMHHLAALYAQVDTSLQLSEETYRGALSYYEQHFGIDQLVSIQILSNLAVLHKKQNLLDDAENDYKSCLVLKDDVLGHSHPSTLATCSNLALLYREQHKFHDAIELLFRVLAGQEVSLGYDHDETLCTLENIAFTFSAMNRVDDAKELLVKSLGLKKEKYGDDSVELLSLYDTLVGVFEVEQDIDRTKRLYNRIIDIRCVHFGPVHPTTLQCQKRLGLFLRNNSRFTEAIELFAKVYQGELEALGRLHHVSIESLEVLIDLYCMNKQYDHALPLQVEVYKCNELFYGENSENAICATHHLGEIYSYYRQYYKASVFHRDGLTKRQKLYGAKHHLTCKSMYYLARDLCNLQEYDEAVSLFLSAIEGFDQTLGETNELSIQAAEAYSVLCRELQDHVESERILQKIVKNKMRSFGPNDPRTLDAVHNLKGQMGANRKRM